MNKKQLFILIVVVVVLGVLGWNRWSKQRDSWNSGSSAIGQKLLGQLDVNAVTKVSVTQGTNQLVLAKKNDHWCVEQRADYPANFGELSSLLIKLKDLKIVQSEPIGASQLPRLELAPGGANPPTVVEFQGADGKPLQTLTLGKKHMKSGGGSGMGGMGEDAGWPDGRYVQTSDSQNTFAVISDPLDALEPDAKRWIKKDFIKVEKPKSISVVFPASTNSWTLSRETESSEWNLADAKPEEKLESSKTSGVTSPFSYPSINDVAVGLSEAETGLVQPTEVRIATFDGFDYLIKVGNKTNESYLLQAEVTANLPKVRTAAPDEKPEDKEKADKEFKEHQKQLEEKLARESAFSKWIFEVSTWTVDSILKQRSELLAEAKPVTDESTAPPATSEGAEGFPSPPGS